MARMLRMQFAGAIHNVTFRGNARQSIFADDPDRARLTARVAERAEDFGVRVFLYCWMANHGHLLVETPAGNLSAFMGSVRTGYTVYYNLRHGRCGHLMQGRFKMCAQPNQATPYWRRFVKHLGSRWLTSSEGGGMGRGGARRGRRGPRGTHGLRGGTPSSA